MRRDPDRHMFLAASVRCTVMGAAGWGLVAGCAFLLGGLLKLAFEVPDRWLGFLIGVGAGALFGAVSYELVDEAGRIAGGSGAVGLGLVLGSFGYLVVSGRGLAVDSEATGRLDVRAIVSDVVAEAVVVVGSLLAGHGVTVAVVAAVMICGSIEAVAATEALQQAGRPNARIAVIWIAMPFVAAATAGIAYAALHNSSELLVAFTLALAGGAIMTNLTTDLIPKSNNLVGALAGPGVVVGFALVFGLVEVL